MVYCFFILITGILFSWRAVVFAVGDAKAFTIGMLDGPFRIGVPFNIPVVFQDEFCNVANPPPNAKPKLEAG